MPIIKQAKKRMRQNEVRRKRNRHYLSHMKSMIKLILEYVKKGDSDKANKVLPKAISSIDTASKKNIIHKKNAAHKKSKIQKAMNGIKTKKDDQAKEPVKEKKEVKKVSKPKKETKSK